MVFTRSQKEIKLFTWMSSDQDSFSKPRMRPGSCQQCTRSAWTITALLLQAFLQQGDTKQFLSALWWPKPLCLHGNPTSGQTTSCLCGCQTNPPACHCGSWLQASALLLPPCPTPRGCGQVEESSHFSVWARPDRNSERAKIASLDFCFSAWQQGFGLVAWLTWLLCSSCTWSNRQMP